jgi:hypothetical protein
MEKTRTRRYAAAELWRDPSLERGVRITGEVDQLEALADELAASCDCDECLQRRDALRKRAH